MAKKQTSEVAPVTTPVDTTSTTPALPKLPRLPKAKKVADKPCGCGCGQLVARRFAPGHDSRLHAWVLRVERGVVALESIEHVGVREAVARQLSVGGSGSKVEKVA